jgi:1,4-dihydroxy-2-naphthoate octaprenyltransferase
VNLGTSVPPTGIAPGQPATRSDQPPAGWRLWWVAIRPRTLTIAVAPVLAGTALAVADTGRLDLAPMAAALFGAVAIQAGTNLYNDVGDALRGGDQPLRQGPPRLTALGWASPARVRRAALIAFGLAALAGLYLAAVGGWPILALGAASLVAGWAYSGGPWPIAYTPLGEVFVIAFFGVGAVSGSYWLQAHALSPAAMISGAALGLVAAAVLLANNYRDMEADRLAGRRTLAIRMGCEPSKALYAVLLLLPFALLASPIGPGYGWIALLALPLALRLIRRFVTEARGPAFNLILGHTARLELVVAALIAVGVGL